MKRLPFVTLALACLVAALALAGCGGSASVDGTPRSVSWSPQRQAVAEAAVIMKGFVPPPGAREVSVSPAPSSPIDGRAASLVVPDDDLVTKTSWWLADGDPGQLMQWEAARLPASYVFTGSSYPLAADGMKFGTWKDSFYLHDVPGLFDERGLQVSATPAAHGQTTIRVDAFVDWIPVRQAADTVPATARVVTLTETSGPVGDAAGTTVTTRTVNLTDRAKVAELAAYLNRQAVNVPGAGLPCPIDFVQSITVTFRARADGPVLAQASGDPTGCGALSFSVPGRASIGIGGAEAPRSLLNEIDGLAGLSWKAGPDGGPTGQ